MGSAVLSDVCVIQPSSGVVSAVRLADAYHRAEQQPTVPDGCANNNMNRVHVYAGLSGQMQRGRAFTSQVGILMLISNGWMCRYGPEA